MKNVINYCDYRNDQLTRTGFRPQRQVFVSASRGGTQHAGTDTTMAEANEVFRKKFISAFCSDASFITRSNFQFAMFNNWYDSLFVAYKEFSTFSLEWEERKSIYRLKYSLLRAERRVCVTSNIAGSKEEQAYDILSQIWSTLTVSIQMETQGGSANAPQDENKIVEVESNTIMELNDGQQEGILSIPNLDNVKNLANTEITYNYPQTQKRWQLLDNFKITSGTIRNGLNKVYKLPKDLFLLTDKAPNSANTLPFATFAYADCDIKIKVVVNGARFATGAILVSSYPDPHEGFDTLSCKVEAMIQRVNTVQISLSSNNSGEILIPNLYRRSFVRCFADSSATKGVSTQQYGSLQIEVLSPYNVVTGQSNTCSVQVFYEFVKCDFAGMTYGEIITPQAPPILDSMVSLGTTLYPAAKPVENLLRRVGVIGNQDKPYGGQIIPVVPQPRMNFSAGKGVSDNIPLTLDHASTVTILPDHLHPEDPQSILEIAKKPGIESYFKWSTSDASGSILKKWPIAPITGLVTDSRINTTPTPLRYCSSMFQMWRGTIELELIFISNDFHTGTIQVETSFNRSSESLAQLSGTYTKTFELGENKSMKYTIPYIYDTVWRRTGRQLDDCILDNRAKDDSDTPKELSQHAAGMSGLWTTALMERTKAFVSITVINPLNPIQSAPSTIEVVMILSAGSDYMLHSIMPNQFHTAYHLDQSKNLPNFGRFPSLPFTADSSVSDPSMWVPIGGSASDKVPSYFFNSFGTRSDEGIASYKSLKLKPVGTNPAAVVSIQMGPAFKTFHTTDNQLLLKDLMRRPVMIYSGTTIARKSVDILADTRTLETSNSFWFPCHVPNHFDGLTPMSRTQVSPVASIATLFRHWRGSLCYTLDFETLTSSPIYVSYVPQTGVRYCGVQRWPTKITKIGSYAVPMADQEVRDLRWIAETGVATEICKPNVNPTISVRVPFDTTLNTCVVSKRVRSSANVKNIMAREETSDISGHLVIQTDEAVPFKIFFSVGDDFELSHFVGTPWYNQYVCATMSDDFSANSTSILGFTTAGDKALTAVSKAQDFHNSDLSLVTTDQSNLEVKIQMEKVAAIVAGASVGLGVVGVNKIRIAAGETQEHTREVLGRVSEVSDEGIVFLRKAGIAVDKVAATADSLGVTMIELVEVLKSAFETAKGSIAGFCKDIMNVNFLIGFFLDFFLLLKDFSAMNLSVHILKLVNSLFPTLALNCLDYLGDLARIVSNLLGCTAHEQQSGVQPKTGCESLFGLLVYIIGTGVGVHSAIDGKRYVDFSSAFIGRMTSVQGLTFLPAALNFVQFFFESVRNATAFVLGYSDPTMNVRQFLKLRKGELEEFMEDVDLITNPLNTKMMKVSEMRQKIWKNFVRAEQINKALAQLDSNQGSTLLLRYVERMRKFADEKGALSTCCPVRREPFVVCVVGGSKIGKSYVAHELSLELLHAAGVSIHGNPVYTRTPGLKHWDGFMDETVISYDDWLNMSHPDCVVEQLSELFCLKSSCDFIPPMANIVDKGIRANPYLVTLLTNDAFPHDLVSCTAHTTEAVYRRRDVLVEAQLKAEFAGIPFSKMPEDVQLGYKHLRFRFTDPINQEVINTANEFQDYEPFKESLIKKFQCYTEQETKNVQRRLALLRKFASNSSLIDDPTEVLHREAFKLGVAEMYERDPEFTDQFLSEKLYEHLRGQRAPLDLKKKILEAQGMNPILSEQAEGCVPSTSISTQGQSEPCVQGPREGLIGNVLDSLPMIGQIFEKGYLPQVGNVTTIPDSGLRMDDFCHHCSSECFFYLGPSTHLLCLKCYFMTETVCVGCVERSTARFLSNITHNKIKELLVLGDRGIYLLTAKIERLSPMKKLAIFYAIMMSFSVGLAVWAEKCETYRQEKELAFGKRNPPTYYIIDPRIIPGNMDDLRIQMDSPSEVKRMAEVMEVNEPTSDKIKLGEEALEEQVAFELLKLGMSKHQTGYAKNIGFNVRSFVTMMGEGFENPVDCLHSVLFKEENPCLEYTRNGWEIYDDELGDIVLPLGFCNAECVLREEKLFTKYFRMCVQWQYLQRDFLSSKLRLYLQHRVTEKQVFDLDAIMPPFSIPAYAQKNKVENLKRSTRLDKFLARLDDTIPSWARFVFKAVYLSLKVVGLIVGLKAIVSYLSPAKAEIMSSGSYQVRHFLKKQRVIKASKIRGAKVESSDDLMDAIQSKILNNSLNIEIYHEGKRVQRLGLTGMYNRCAIMPKHYYGVLAKFSENSQYEMFITSAKYSHMKISYTFSMEDFELGEADIAIFNVPKTVHTFSDLRKYCAKETDYELPLTTDGRILCCRMEKTDFLYLHKVKFYGIDRELQVKGTDETFMALDSLCYNFSQEGACGSLVMRERNTRPIVAMHFAGNNSKVGYTKGYGVLLSQEMFEDLIGPNEIIVEEEIELDPPENASQVLSEKVSVQSLGTYPREVFIPTKTKILPSLIQQFLPPVLTRPGFLSKSHPEYPHELSPLLAGCSKHGILTKNFATSEIREVSDALWTMKYIRVAPLMVAPKKLSLKEAIGGLDFPGYPALHLNTSMGFDWVFESKTQKGSYIEIQRNVQGVVEDVLVSRHLLDELNRVTALREQGIIPFVPYIDELKDERRRLDKRMQLGSTRVFCMSSVLTSIPVRQNFLHFSAAYTWARIHRLNHAVGISHDGHEWGELVKRLHEVSDNIVTLDYSNFGPGYNAMVNAAGHDIIQNWTAMYVGGVNSREMQCLGEEHYNSKHIMGNLVYRQLSGGPSGDAMTVIKNGLVNEMYIMLAWKGIMAEWCLQHGEALYPAFENETRLITYGDDLIMSISDRVKDLFNGVTIPAFLAKYGIVATDALKSGKSVAYATIEQSSFLKCGFKPHPTRNYEWLAPLDEISVYETAKWIHECPNYEEATLQNAEAALRNMFGHGKERFNEWRTTINLALLKAGLDGVYLTWEELDKLFFGGHLDVDPLNVSKQCPIEDGDPLNV